MQLAEYLAANEMTLAEFAEQIGVTVPSVSKLANGVIKPTLDTMQKIQNATRGKVTAADFLQQHAEKRA